jgi:hypothetical protein
VYTAVCVGGFKKLHVGKGEKRSIILFQKNIIQVRYTDKKEKKIFLIHKEIQKEWLQKSYMNDSLLIHG